MKLHSNIIYKEFKIISISIFLTMILASSISAESSNVSAQGNKQTTMDNKLILKDLPPQPPSNCKTTSTSKICQPVVINIPTCPPTCTPPPTCPPNQPHPEVVCPKPNTNSLNP